MKKVAMAISLATVLSLPLLAQAQEAPPPSPSQSPKPPESLSAHTQEAAPPSPHESAKPPASASKADAAKVDQDVALLRQDLRSSKKQMIAANLDLTDEEATKFWPVYDRYAEEASRLGDEKYA